MNLGFSFQFATAGISHKSCLIKLNGPVVKCAINDVVYSLVIQTSIVERAALHVL